MSGGEVDIIILEPITPNTSELLVYFLHPIVCIYIRSTPSFLILRVQVQVHLQYSSRI